VYHTFDCTGNTTGMNCLKNRNANGCCFVVFMIYNGCYFVAFYNLFILWQHDIVVNLQIWCQKASMGKLHQNLPPGGRRELNNNNTKPTSQICMALIFLSCFMKCIKWAKELKIQVFRDMAPCQLVNS